MLQGVFHPGYMRIHRDARPGPRTATARRLPRRGRRDRAPAEQTLRRDDGDRRRGATRSAGLPMIDEPRQAPDEAMDLSRLSALWRGAIEDEYGEAAVCRHARDRPEDARRGGKPGRRRGAGRNAVERARAEPPCGGGLIDGAGFSVRCAQVVGQDDDHDRARRSADRRRRDRPDFQEGTGLYRPDVA